MPDGNLNEPLTRGEFWEWVNNHCETRFQAIDVLRGQMKVVRPLLCAIMGLIGVVILIIVD